MDTLNKPDNHLNELNKKRTLVIYQEMLLETSNVKPIVFKLPNLDKYALPIKLKNV
ncbi:Uncharacterised protein [uncultured archaeon]|nr:Uncharacterised protein [uncultured archaeon]